DQARAGLRKPQAPATGPSPSWRLGLSRLASKEKRLHYTPHSSVLTLRETSSMNRRDFLHAGAAGVALSATAGHAPAFADQQPRVGLIGCGWYGKCDLLRLIQIAPVEVVSLCDVDKKMLAEAADIVASRQKSGKKPRTFGDYRKMLDEKDLDIVL